MLSRQLRYRPFVPSRGTRFLWRIFVSAACFCLSVSVFAGPNGELDLAYGTAGVSEIAVDQIPTGWDYGRDAAVLLDGRLLVLGTVQDAAGDWDCAVSRLLPSGGLDTSFGAGGTSIFSFTSPDGYDDCQAIAVDHSTGRVVVAGSSGMPGSKKVAVARLLDDGSLDAAFGHGGRQTVWLGFDSDMYGLALHTDGRVFVAGSLGVAANDTDFLMVEMSAGGAFLTFATHYFDEGTHDKRDVAKEILLQGDDVLLAGDVNTDTGSMIGVVRISPSRTADLNFGAGGDLLLHLGGARARSSALLRQSDGRLIVVGASDFAGKAVAAVRLSADGLQDPTYGTLGVARSALGTYGDGRVTSAHIDGSDGLVVAGSSAGERAMNAVRFNTFGLVDGTFGNQSWGFQALPTFAGWSPAEAIEIGPGGEIYLVGWSALHPWDHADFVVRKLTDSRGMPFDLVN